MENVSKHVTRVEVHLSDENAGKSGQRDKRWMMEARLEGRQPIAVTEQADTLDQALHGVCHKMIRMIGYIVDTQRRRHRQSDRPDVDGLARLED